MENLNLNSQLLSNSSPLLGSSSTSISWTDLPSQLRNTTPLAGGIVSTGYNLGVTSGYLLIDYGNKRIIINDGTNDRILIGYQKDGF